MKKKEEEKQKNVKKGRRIEKSEKVKKDSKEWKEQKTEDKKHDTGKMETEVEKDLNEMAPSAPEQRVVAVLKERGLTMTTVESCTGGMIAAAVTSVAGSSSVFHQGYVTYCDEAKHEMAGVRKNAEKVHGSKPSDCKRDGSWGRQGCEGRLLHFRDWLCRSAFWKTWGRSRTGLHRMCVSGKSKGKRMSFFRNTW